MKKIIIYEPAMCCPTGLCGVGVDPELLRISSVTNNLKKNGIEIERYNLTNSPMEFMFNKTVNRIINESGVDALPLTLADGEVVVSGRYPSNEEFSLLLDIPANFFSEEPDSDN